MDSLGEWSNAPLVYVLVEVRTERLADIKEYQPKFAGRLRDAGYPIQRTMHAAKLVATGTQIVFEPEHDPAWEFATPDNRTAVMLRPNGVVVHATAYKDTAEFLTRLEEITKIFAAEIPSVYVNRLGLRYIDFVLPKQNEMPEAYVDARLNPDLGLSKTPGGIASISLGIYPRGDGKQLSLRYTRGRGKPEMPPELGMLSLAPSPLMNPPGIDENKPTAVIDMDCSLTYSPVEKLDQARVKAQFVSMYDDIFDAFMKAITDHARRVWGAK